MHKRTFLISFALFLTILLAGCPFIQPPGPPNDGKIYWHGFSWAVVPPQCEDSIYDVCGLFDCMVDQCWCAEVPPSAIIVQGTKPVSSEEAAMGAVYSNLPAVRDRLWPDLEFQECMEQTECIGDVGINVERAVDLNGVFYNVFLTAEGDEKTVTVAADGTIFLTQCGV